MKRNESKDWQEYISPAIIEVEMTSEGVLCQSRDIDDLNELDGYGW